MKLGFNKAFDAVYQLKKGEMKRISDRNTRIRKVMKDLGINDEVFEPSWTSDENPEMLLDVNDDEIKVEKYVSEEEQVKLEELAKVEEGNISQYIHGWRV